MTNSGFNFLSLLNVRVSSENASLVQNNEENVLALLLVSAFKVFSEENYIQD